MYLGIDGFRRGWVGAWIGDDNNQRFDFSARLETLLAQPHDRAMIDMPIGLPDQGLRACDVDAGRIVGGAVFKGARRTLLDFGTMQQANEFYRSRGEAAISCQLWCLAPKLREVDEAIQIFPQPKVRECHPELVFRRVNEDRPLASKHCREGRDARVELLVANGFTRITEWLGQRHGTGIGRDDLIDACACALAARSARHRLPEAADPPDARGLTMEIWF